MFENFVKKIVKMLLEKKVVGKMVEKMLRDLLNLDAMMDPFCFCVGSVFAQK